MAVLATAEGGGVPFHLHLDVWIIMGGLVVGYVLARRRLGPRLAPPGGPVATRRQSWQFAAGMVLFWGFADWPVHDIAEDSLFFVHMTQHTVFSLVAPALVIMGTPMWLRQWLVSPAPVQAVLRRLCRPVPATLLFNAVVIITHWPPWVDITVQNELAHFAAHVLLVGAAVVMWLPVVGRVPGLPSMSPPGRMLYLFLQSIVPTVPASFLAFAERPIYEWYARADRLIGMSAVEDQQVAGAIMKVGGTTILWTAIVVMFFRWYQETQREERDVLTWAQVEREMAKSPPRPEPAARP
ncbi:MAG TPA: cytochrome c oxidase assembly protein [Acidimicrobiales bacterium]|nr:cytochrome c oxidase assembly protein [Acidimicrobiales bacterium]